MTLSRILGILSLIVSVLTVLTSYFSAVIPPDVAVIIVGITAAINAFVERVQGGASKV